MPKYPRVQLCAQQQFLLAGELDKFPCTHRNPKTLKVKPYSLNLQALNPKSLNPKETLLLSHMIAGWKHLK